MIDPIDHLDTVTGVALDQLGAVLGVERVERADWTSDAEYRAAIRRVLSQPPTLQASTPISAAEAAQLRDRQKSQMKLLSQLNASLLSLKAELSVLPSLKSLVDQLNSQLRETTRIVNEQKQKIRELQLEIQGSRVLEERLSEDVG